MPKNNDMGYDPDVRPFVRMCDSRDLKISHGLSYVKFSKTVISNNRRRFDVLISNNLNKFRHSDIVHDITKSDIWYIVRDIKHQGIIHDFIIYKDDGVASSASI